MMPRSAASSCLAVSSHSVVTKLAPHVLRKTLTQPRSHVVGSTGATVCLSLTCIIAPHNPLCEVLLLARSTWASSHVVAHSRQCSLQLVVPDHNMAILPRLLWHGAMSPPTCVIDVARLNSGSTWNLTALHLYLWAMTATSK